MSEAVGKLQELASLLGSLEKTADGLGIIKDCVNTLRERVKDLSISNEKKEELIRSLNQWVLMLHGFVIEDVINDLNKATKELSKG